MSVTFPRKKPILLLVGLVIVLSSLAFGYHLWTNQVAISKEQVQAIVADEIGKDKLSYAYLTLSRKEKTPRYHIKATADNEVYEMAIDADTGKVLSTEIQLITESTQAITTKGGYKCNCRPYYPRAAASISEKEARTIVENTAKQSPVIYTRFQLIQAIDNVDKPLYYEVQVYAGDTQYDIDIDAITGKILDSWTEKI